MAVVWSPFSVGSIASASRPERHQASTHRSSGAKQRLTSSSVWQGRARSLPSYNHSRRYSLPEILAPAVPAAPGREGGRRGVLAGAPGQDSAAHPQNQAGQLWLTEVRPMRANRLLQLIGFLGKAQGRPPAFGFVTTKMPDSPAPSQATSKPNFSRYIPLSALPPGEGPGVRVAPLRATGKAACRRRCGLLLLPAEAVAGC